MLKFLADENFNGGIIRGALRRLRSIDLVRIQDIGLRGAKDDVVLEWAASHARVVLTHDVRTMIAAAYARVRAGQVMPGVIEVPVTLGLRLLIEELVLIAECGQPEDFDDQVHFLRPSDPR